VSIQSLMCGIEPVKKSLKEIGMNITSLVELEPLLEQQINKK